MSLGYICNSNLSLFVKNVVTVGAEHQPLLLLGVQPRPGPHHSLATLLYSVVMQVTLEFKCPGDSAFAIYSFQDEAEDADISALP